MCYQLICMSGSLYSQRRPLTGYSCPARRGRARVGDGNPTTPIGWGNWQRELQFVFLRRICRR